MNVDRVVEERKKLEAIVDNCKFETPEQIAELFEAYTALIWKHQQIGRIYDFYYDGMMIHRQGGEDVVGVEDVIRETMGFIAAFSDLELVFRDIWCVGNPEDGFRFGQSCWWRGTHDGPGKFGPGNGRSLQQNEMMDLCQCDIRKVEGRWRVAEEWGIQSTDTRDSIQKEGKGECECEEAQAPSEEEICVCESIAAE